MMPRHGLHFERFVWEALPAGGAHAGGIFGVEFADEDRSEIDGAAMRAQRFEAEGFADEGTPDEAQAALPFDVAMRAHAAGGKGEPVPIWWT